MTTKRPSLTVAIPLATVAISGGGWIVKHIMDVRERLVALEAVDTDGLTNRLRVVETEAVRQERIKALWERLHEIGVQLSNVDKRLAKIEP
jgi:hypothetical protein